MDPPTATLATPLITTPSAVALDTTPALPAAFRPIQFPATFEPARSTRTPAVVLPEIVFGVAPPTTTPAGAVASTSTPMSFGSAAAPAASRPITLPRRLAPVAPAPLIQMPACVAPPIVFPSAAVVPPSLMPATLSITSPSGRAIEALPASVRPIQFPAMIVPARSILTLKLVFPLMTFGRLPPITTPVGAGRVDEHSDIIRQRRVAGGVEADHVAEDARPGCARPLDPEPGMRGPGDRVPLGGRRPADRDVGDVVDDDPVRPRDRRVAGQVEADPVAGDPRPRRLDLDREVRVAADDVRPASADHDPRRRGRVDEHAHGVRQGRVAGGVEADHVAEDARPRRAGPLDPDAGMGRPGDRVPLGRRRAADRHVRQVVDDEPVRARDRRVARRVEPDPVPPRPSSRPGRSARPPLCCR